MTDSIGIFTEAKSKRHRAETRFRVYGMLAIAVSLTFLVAMVGSIALRGSPTFMQSFVQIEIGLPIDEIDSAHIKETRFNSLLKRSLREDFPEAKTRKEKKQLYGLVSSIAEYTVRDHVAANPKLIGTRAKLWVRTSSDVDMFLKGYMDISLDESRRRLKDSQLAWIARLQNEGRVEFRFNTKFFTGGDSREPEQADVFGAVIGSALSLLVCFSLSFPLGVSAAWLGKFNEKHAYCNIL